MTQDLQNDNSKYYAPHRVSTQEYTQPVRTVWEDNNMVCLLLNAIKWINSLTKYENHISICYYSFFQWNKKRTCEHECQKSNKNKKKT